MQYHQQLKIPIPAKRVLCLLLCALMCMGQPLGAVQKQSPSQKDDCLGPVLESSRNVSSFSAQLAALAKPAPAPAPQQMRINLKELYPEAFAAKPHHGDEHEVSNTKALASVLGLAFSFGTVEMALGCAVFGSMALGADAVHMFADSFGLVTSLVASVITTGLEKAPKPFFVKQLEKINRNDWIYMEKSGTSVWKMISSLTIATLMFLSGLHIISESISRFANPAMHDVTGLPVFIIAVTGLLVNLLNSWILDGKSVKTFPLISPFVRLFGKKEKNAPKQTPLAFLKQTAKDFAAMFKTDDDMDMSLWAAKLHFLGDILGSVSAIVVAVIIMLTANMWVDLVGSSLVAAWMFINTGLIAKEVLGLSPSYSSTIHTLSQLHCLNMRAGGMKLGQISEFCDTNPENKNQIARHTLISLAQSRQWFLGSNQTIKLRINKNDTLEILENGTLRIEGIKLPVKLPRYKVKKAYRELKTLWKKDIAKQLKPTLDVFERNKNTPALELAA